ncbi:DUF309 domain-containing protein [Maliponia aquimaris]|uniref:DUF309 domain-containing protein n=1 Tax=Maliponia aquimaris TaxID=1673631 RepID=A0A238L5B5_9RHOB|nr:DUF309 domain-containing protein [Maliponia aquimaris]SMX50199.1 hypothetical protein MAA8898_04657 [Maliponia aquimaris]
MLDLPRNAYLPGLTPRPAEGAYDALKAVRDPLPDSPAWHAGLRFFEAGYYWEAHEVWEVVWMTARANSAERALVQGMIQLANAGLKRRMGRERAALRLDTLAGAILAEALARGGAEVMRLTPEGIAAAQRAVQDQELHYNA